jgi:UDP-N-acetylmuramoylalanine--D-glutamate ligase
VIEIDVRDTSEVMPEVVARASEVALDGDTVLLAPAAASMDQFDSYGDRGDKFRAAVERMAQRGAGQDASNLGGDSEPER